MSLSPALGPREHTSRTVAHRISPLRMLPLQEETSVHLFFSYCHDDKAAVHLLRNAFPKSLPTFIDVERLQVGSDLPAEVQRAVANSAYFILLLSRNSLASTWVQTELKLALDSAATTGYPVIMPVLLDKHIGDDDLPSDLRQLIRINFTDHSAKAAEDCARELVTNIAVSSLKKFAEGPISIESLGRNLLVSMWRRRGDITPNEWSGIYQGAQRRIWLLGHTMSPPFDTATHGDEIIVNRLRSGVEVRLVVLDPYGPDRRQVEEISRANPTEEFGPKIERTLARSRAIQRRLGLSESTTRDAIRLPNMDVAVTADTIHNSIVIVDDRFLVTLYSHNRDMGKEGPTLDLNSTNPAHEKSCALLEKEFVEHWLRSTPSFDWLRSLPRVESRILSQRDSALNSRRWYMSKHGGGASSALNPPHLAVIFPTYTCDYGPRSAREARLIGRSQQTIQINGPHAKLLCPNCMYASVLNRGPRHAEGSRSQMTVPDFRNAVEQLIAIGVKMIEISGGGEPLFHRNFIELLGVINSLREQSPAAATVNFGLLSNVVGLEELMRRGRLSSLAESKELQLVLSTLSYVRWSIPEDADLAPRFEAKIIENLRRLLEMRRSLARSVKNAARIKIGVKVLATKGNTATDAAEPTKPVPLVRFVAALLNLDGLSHVKVRSLRSKSNGPDEIGIRRAANQLSQLSAQLQDQGVLRGRDHLEVDIRPRLVPADYKCQISSLMTVIEPNGDVRMCWNDVESGDRRLIGNIFDVEAGGLRGFWGGAQHHRVCQNMAPSMVCNAEAGCHCRFVGYQDFLERATVSGKIVDDDRMLGDPFL